jgi:hypothetical protein
MPVVCRRTRLGAAFIARALLTTAFALLVGSCGNNQIDNGTPVITATATNTVFSSFVVSIASVTLTRNDGYTFTILGATGEQRADLTKITDLTELVEAPAVPSGTYKTGTITLDFGAPIINVVSAGGQTVPAAAVDSTGAALSTVTLTFNLDPNNPLVINSHQGTAFGLEFDLAASTIVNTSASPVQVVFTPVVVASTKLTNPSHTLRVRGTYLTTDQGNNSFIINGTPFDDQFSYQYNGVGAVKVTVDGNTTYDINGVVYTGANGLAQIAKTSLNAYVSAVGSLSDITQVTPTLHATQVYAGASLESLGVDRLVGTVTARSATTLTVHGTLVTQRVGTYYYFNDIPVTVGSSTLVNVDGSATTGLTNQAISIGQQVLVIGQAAADPTTGVVTGTGMDATAGEVRMQSTRLWGQLNSATPGSLVMGLTAVGLFDPSAFDFAGTGVAAGSDASAAAYAVNTGTLDLSATAANTELYADGLVTPFGSAPPDFTASAATAAPGIDSILEVEWASTGTAAPFSSSNSSGLVVDLTNANLGAVHRISTGPFITDLLSLSASPLIVPDTANGTNYSVGAGGGLVLNTFLTFSGFVTQVGTELSTKTMRKLVAVGRYDTGSNTFTAKRVNLVEE